MKPDCYQCKHSRNVPGNAHLACQHPAIMGANGSVKMIALQLFYLTREFPPFKLTANEHGIRNGWCFWPINFDPVWLNNCDGFEKKEEEQSTKP